MKTRLSLRNKKIKIMKKIYLILLLLITGITFSQSELTVRITNTSGTATNSLTASEIRFRYSPYGAGDTITGLTVSQPSSNTNGVYLISGFSTWYYEVEMWVSGSKNTAFGRKTVGNPQTVFLKLAGSSQSLSSIVTSSVNFFMYNPFMHTSSGYYTDLTTLANNSLVPKLFITSRYLDTSYIRTSGAYIILDGSLKLKNENDAKPFDISSQFNWSSGLNLNKTQDSIIFNKLGVYVDTTYVDETVGQKSWITDRKGYGGDDSLGVKSYYARGTSGTWTPLDSFYIFNKPIDKVGVSDVGLGTTYANMDTIILTPGTWDVRYEARYIFGDSTCYAPPNSDTITTMMRTDLATITNSTTFVSFTYGSATAKVGMSGIITRSFTYKITATTTIYLRAKSTQNVTSKHYLGSTNLHAIRIY